jgi:hypothetical protein
MSVVGLMNVIGPSERGLRQGLSLLDPTSGQESKIKPSCFLEDEVSFRPGGQFSAVTTAGEVARPGLSLRLLPAWSPFKFIFSHRHNDGVPVSPSPHCHSIPGNSHRFSAKA